MLRALLITVLAFAALPTQSVEARAAAPSPARVTFIGDSVATAILYTAAAQRILGRGVEVDYQLAVCRRLVGTSCPYEGSAPPTLVDLVPTIDLAPTVVVAVGYNDRPDTFPQAVESSLAALEKGGAKQILWLTLRAERQSYSAMNDAVRAAATRHDDLTVVDWDLYSRSHPDWFQGDGLHLGYGGAVGMATLVHGALDGLGLVAPPVAALAIVTRALPAARVARPYLTRLTASGGTRPITWALTAGALPTGVRLLADGRLTGTPRVAGRSAATLRATDATGRAASRRLTIAVRAR